MDEPIALTIKAKGKGKSGLQVELREDGHYYISKVPRGTRDFAVGYRVLEINGVKLDRFRDEVRANDLIDTFQLEIIPVDEEGANADTDDDMDFDLEENVSSTQQRGLQKQTKKVAAGLTGRNMGSSRREVVEYLDESDSDEGTAPKGGQNRGIGPTNTGAPKKALPGKGSSRREVVEYLDESDSDEGTAPKGGQNRGIGPTNTGAPKKALPGKGSSRREVVEYLDESDSDESAGYNPAIGSTENATLKKVVPEKGRGRRDAVEYLYDDEDDDDDVDDDIYDDGDGDDTDDEELGEIVRPRPGSGETGRDRREDNYIDDDEDVDEDDDIDEDEEDVHLRSNVRGPNTNENFSYDDKDEYKGGDAGSVSGSGEDSEDDDKPRKQPSVQSLRHAMAKKQDSERALYRPKPSDFDRPYVSNYIPLDRWMLTVEKREDEGFGISIVQYKRALYVTDVEGGPFYKTALDKGDKILAINGKKIPKHITTVTEAEELMEGKTKLTIFILRPDPNDLGYQWVMENF